MLVVMFRKLFYGKLIYCIVSSCSGVSDCFKRGNLFGITINLPLVKGP